MRIDKFRFKSDRRSVLRIRENGRDTWYHLSQGRKQWALRTFAGGFATPTYYSPNLTNYQPIDVDDVEQLDLDTVQAHTRERLHGISTIDEGGAKWQHALNLLAQRDAPVPTTSSTKQPRVDIDPDESSRSPIPLTGMRHLYAVLKDFGSIDCHLGLAREAEGVNVAIRIAERFQTSVRHFGKYANTDDRFYPNNRAELEPFDKSCIPTTTAELTSLLKQASEHGNIWCDRDDLSFEYVDREISPARTSSVRFYENGLDRRHTIALDWLLRNQRDKQPIIAEVKIGNDKNPFFALIQALTCAVELITRPQLVRLARCYPTIEVPCADMDDDGLSTPTADVYIVLCNYQWDSPKQREIADSTERVAKVLMEETVVARHIRRIACLKTDGKFQPLKFQTVFAFGGD